MFWIFANDIHNTLAPNNTALGTALANGGRNFHEKISLLIAAVHRTAKGLIIPFVYQIVHIFIGSLRRSQDSQDERFTFGDGNGMFEMRRQRAIRRDNRPLIRQDAGFVRPN
jgi:hypothetical protein